MPAVKTTHYEVLGVSTTAKREEITRAYRRLVKDLEDESSMPDPLREVRLHEAYEVLSDSHRRSFYDAELRKPKLLQGLGARAKDPRLAIGLALAAAVTGIASYFVLRGPSGPEPLSQQDIVAAISRSVGQVQSIELSGRVTPVGVAFAVDKGSLVTACPVVPPGSQLMVRLGARTAPAQVAAADEELGVCKLAVADAGSWPLVVTAIEPRNGDTVYVARVTTAGDVSVAAVKVKGSKAGRHGKLLQLGETLGALEAGSPVLDGQARVVGIAAPPDQVWPARWISDARARRRSP